MFLIEVLFQN